MSTILLRHHITLLGRTNWIILSHQIILTFLILQTLLVRSTCSWTAILRESLPSTHILVTPYIKIRKYSCGMIVIMTMVIKITTQAQKYTNQNSLPLTHINLLKIVNTSILINYFVVTNPITISGRKTTFATLSNNWMKYFLHRKRPGATSFNCLIIFAKAQKILRNVSRNWLMITSSQRN